MGSNDMRIRIVVIGDGGVGKSAITMRYLQNTFSEVSSAALTEKSMQFVMSSTAAKQR